MFAMLPNSLAQKVFFFGEFFRNELITEKLRELNKNQFKSTEEVEMLRIEKLRRLLNQASSYSPFYKKRLSHVDLSQIRGFDVLNKRRDIDEV